jgi:hypothetical protein
MIDAYISTGRYELTPGNKNKIACMPEACDAQPVSKVG